MKVSELINFLQKCNADYDVKAYTSGEDVSTAGDLKAATEIGHSSYCPELCVMLEVE